MNKKYRIIIRDSHLFGQYEAELHRRYTILWRWSLWLMVQNVSGKWFKVGAQITCWKNNYDISEEQIQDLSS